MVWLYKGGEGEKKKCTMVFVTVKCYCLISSGFIIHYRLIIMLDFIIVIIFSFLQNRVYVETKLSSTLRTELQKIFCTAVIDPVIARLLGKC